MKISKPNMTMVKATTTPLASIFGSGFLIIIPILNGAVGPYSIFAMIVVCALAYAVGGTIRHNIKHAQPALMTKTAPRPVKVVERFSDFSLVLAYIISVCLYLRILSSFLLGGFGVDSQFWEQVITTAIILIIGFVAMVEGLRALESLEDYALWITLFIIVVLLVGFASYDYRAIASSSFQLPGIPSHDWWQMATILGGILITVQGFETSRYLEDRFDTETRIRSCRRSQIISSVVYITFVALATPLMHYLGDVVRGNSLILLAGKASALFPIPLVLAAILSQFSAAVADTLGGEGNMVEASGRRIRRKPAYVVICGGAILLTWFASTLEIVALASRAFALYYMLQCLVAMLVNKDLKKRLGFLALAGVLAWITVFAVPAS